MAIGLLGKTLSALGPVAGAFVGSGGLLRTGPAQPAPATGANLPIPNYADFVQKMSKINFLLELRGLPPYDIQKEYANLIETRENMNERYGERERALEAVRQSGPVLQSAIEKILYTPDPTKDQVQTQLGQIV